MNKLLSIFFLFVLLLTACGDSTMYVVLYTSERSGAVEPGESKYEDVVVEAVNMLGHDVQLVDESQERGAVSIELFDSDVFTDVNNLNFVGRMLFESKCYKGIWAINNPFVIAHEIGHTFSLDHSDDPDNIMSNNVENMNRDIEEMYLSDSQQEVIDEGVQRMNRCIE